MSPQFDGNNAASAPVVQQPKQPPQQQLGPFVTNPGRFNPLTVNNQEIGISSYESIDKIRTEILHDETSPVLSKYLWPSESLFTFP